MLRNEQKSKSSALTPSLSFRKHQWLLACHSHYSHCCCSNAIWSLLLLDDADPLTFSATLSFLRSGKVPLLASLDSEFLEQWLVEANFYQLESLSKAVSEELALRRSHPVYPPMNALRFKAVHDSVVNQYFERGWAFVTSYRGSQTNICLVTGDTAHWNFYTNECTGCAGQMLSYEDFSKHCSQHENSMMVICKQLSQADEEADDLESLSEELLSDDRTSKRLSKRLSARLPFISSTTRLW